MDLREFKAAWEPRDYSSPARRKQLIDREFKAAVKAYASVGRRDAWTDEEQRKTELMKAIDRARAELPSLRVHSPEESLVDFEVMCFTNYRFLEDSFNYTLGATIWVLDELRRTGKLHDAYDFLPSSRMEIDEIYTPMDFYHPCYEDDLIQSVAHVLDPKNSTGDWTDQFDGLMDLLDSEKVTSAVEKFKDLQWKAMEIFLRCIEYYDQKSRRIMQEIESLQKPNPLMVVRPENTEERIGELAQDGVDLSKDRKHFTSHFEDFIGTNQRRIMDSRELGKIMNEFRIEDPFEICFALIYMIGYVDDAIWSMKAGASVVSAAGRMLPWYVSPEDWDEDEDPWEGMTFDRGNDWLEKTGLAEDLKRLYSQGKGGKNLAQRVYGLCKGMMPVGFHPFEEEREQMKTAEDPDADLIADQAEILFLSAFQAGAANFRGKHWWESEEDEFLSAPDVEDEVREADAGTDTASAEEIAPPQIHGMWGMVAKEQGRSTSAEELPEPPAPPPVTEEKMEAPDTSILLERARKEIKNLKKALSEISREAEDKENRYEHELKTLRMEHRELADLRELVFNREQDQRKVEKVEKQYSYPYSNRKRTVIFGGHDSFLRAIKPMLPDVRFVDADNITYSPEIIRNADVVWIQNNCISHPQYWSIVKNCKLAGVQMRYFAFASAEKCAEQLVDWDQK